MRERFSQEMRSSSGSLFEISRMGATQGAPTASTPVDWS